MRYVRCAFVGMMFSLIMLSGCAISADQQKKMDALVAENEALYQKQRDLLEKVKKGEASPAEVAQAFSDITAQMKKNADEIKTIRESGTSTAAIIGAVVGTLGRSAIHAFAGILPGGTPLADGLQGLLTLLLGGSETKKKEEGAPA